MTTTERDVKQMANALVALQNQYVAMLEENQSECEGVLSYYTELAEDVAKKTQVSSKYACQLLANPDFHEAFNVESASFYMPMMTIVETSVTFHLALAKTLMDESGSWLSTLIGKLILHVSSAVDSMEALEGSHPDREQDVLYHPNDARTIIMASSRIIKSMMDTVQPEDRRRILAFMVREHPRTPEVMTRCSELVEEERELARLALVLGGESIRQQEALARQRSAVVLQATWRAVLTRRRFKVMQRGFKKLQNLYRDQRRLLDRELSLNERFKESEGAFDKKFQAMIARRVSAEEKLRELEAKPPKDLADYILALEREEERDGERNEADILHDMVTAEENEKLDSAALKIQAAVRRWLIRKRDRRPAIWSRNLLRTTMTEAKVRSYQDKIELWQQRNRVAPMTPHELQELHQKTQSEFSKFSARLNKNRLEDHKAMALLAQTDTALAVMECAPSLREYTTSQWSQFHSLPLHVAIKGRMEHNSAMRRMEQDRWKRILEDYG